MVPSGLLDAFCWWPSETAADFEVVRVREGKQSKLMLSEALEPIAPSDVRLVSLYAATAEEEFDPSFSDVVAQRLEAARDVVAWLPGAPLGVTAIVIPASIGQQVPPQLFRADADTNVLVVPEDRRTPDATNVLGDTSSVLPAHAAHAAATIADLWKDPRPNPPVVLDSLRPPPGYGEEATLVVPARCYSRVVDLGYVADHVAAEVFRPQDGSWPNPDPKQFDRMPDPTDHLRYVAVAFLKKHDEVLGLTPFKRFKSTGLQCSRSSRR